MDGLTRRKGWLVLAAALGLLFGCQRPAPPDSPTAAQVSRDELEPIWDAALSVLRKHDFQPDRQDRAQGVITTLPSTSMQWGEFWRQDTADVPSYAESSVQTVQRKATVHFVRERGSGGWTVDVQVDVYRLHIPESQITTASSAFQAFSGTLPSTEGTLRLHGEARRSWVHLGRDAAMESRLLNRILATASAA